MMAAWSRLLDRLAFSRPVDVIMPVFRNTDLTREALMALRDSEPVGRFRLVLIDDASPEPDMRPMLLDFVARCPHPVLLIRHAHNLGFTASVNEGMCQSRFRNVVLLNSDALVSPGWLTRLNAQAARNERAATLTPFSNNATIASFPGFCRDNPMPDGWSRGELDALFARELAGESLELPTAVGFCMWIRRAALRQLGLFDERRFPRGYGEENDFSRRAVKAGWQNRLAADVFVQHVGGVSFAEEAQALQQEHGRRLQALHPEYEREVQTFISADPPAALRRRVMERMRGKR